MLHPADLSIHSLAPSIVVVPGSESSRAQKLTEGEFGPSVSRGPGADTAPTKPLTTSTPGVQP